ncbi:MAG: carbohydrate-binding family 9-like protein [Lentisphaeria bacterium]|nr:carbohydrate-binding family 9-like protein [Lentisphaeria bacterium]
MKRACFYLTLPLLLLLLNACSSLCCRVPSGSAVVQAVYTPSPLVLDGRLDEAAWADAPAYYPQLGRGTYDKLPVAMQATVGRELREPGYYKLLWDEDYLYVGAQFVDSDVHAYGEEDQEHHYTLGDVAEVFIKPASDTYYWELYGTPAAKMSTFFIPGRGALMGPLLTSDPFELKVASQVQGTLNQWQDKDQGWSMEMAIPRTELEKFGAKFNPEQGWSIFLARYNYCRYLPSKEMSSFPQQQETANFHMLEEYATLQLLKP